MLTRLLRYVTPRTPRPEERLDEQPSKTLAADLASSGVSFDAWLDRCLWKPWSYAGLTPAVEAIARRRLTHRIKRLIETADLIVSHQFDLLGSGPYVPVDPERAHSEDYRPIDWTFDPVASARFPRTPIREWSPALTPAGADIKRPWELGRCQHWVPLAQASALTGRPSYAAEIRNQLRDFVSANPVGVGVNWLCTMDVAIRAANWAIALDLIRDAGVDRAFWRDAWTALFDHCVFIEAHLENKYEVTSNHFLSDAVGLLIASAPFASLPSGQRWIEGCRDWIECEMGVQVLDDGADFESSVPYHRLVTELFLGAARISQQLGFPMSDRYMTKLREMVDYFAAVQRPDGLMPQVGDADDGRLHLFDYGGAAPQNGCHLFGAAAAVCGQGEAWLAAGGEAAEWEAAWWGGVIGTEPVVERQGDVNRLFADAGLAVARAGGTFLLVTNGRVGTKGFGNHKHNDQLSFEYHHRGVPLVVDPGSYVYTSDPEARNRFRGTAWHNTLSIDGVEQNDMRPEWLFRLFETANGEHVAFSERGGAVEYVGRHHGYERLTDPVMHERTLRLERSTGTLEIVDRLRGCGAHTLRWHFHLAPGIEPRDAGGSVALRAANRRWMLSVPPDAQVAIGSAEYSPSYGVRVPCFAVDATVDTTIDGERRWRFAVAPCD